MYGIENDGQKGAFGGFQVLLVRNSLPAAGIEYLGSGLTSNSFSFQNAGKAQRSLKDKIIKKKGVTVNVLPKENHVVSLKWF